MGWFIAPAPSEAIESPCIGICTLDDRGLCMGCRRNTEEIAMWLDLSPEQRRRIMECLDDRAQSS